MLADAAADFARVQRRQTWARLARRLQRRPDHQSELLAFDEVVGTLGRTGQRELGLHTVEIDTIIGSVDRAGDFDRWFRPRPSVDRQRWIDLDRADRAGAIFPPIEVYRVDRLHFVRDGHHRLSVARVHGRRAIDAFVTEVTTRLSDATRGGHDGPGGISATTSASQLRAGDSPSTVRRECRPRIIEPTSKHDSLRVLTETGLEPVSCRTIKRRLPVYATDGWRQQPAAACASHTGLGPGLGPTSLVMFDVSTLYFETDAGDGFREPGSPRNAAWNRRSPSGCSSTHPGFR